MNQTARGALWVLMAGTLLVRLLWGGLLPAGNDEAYHYLFTVHPDWSYFDHPPMTMLVAKIGLTLSGGAVTPLSLRLGFILMFAGSTWVLFRWTARWYGDWAGFYAALALNFTAYYTAAAGAFALPDGPLLFFSLLTLWRLSEALVRNQESGVRSQESGDRSQESVDGLTPDSCPLLPWVWVGLAWAGALLSKYHAVFLPAGALLYVLATPSARRCLLTPGPYLAALLGMCGFLPVLIWNVQHDWASFAFQAGRAVGMQFRPDALFTALGGQILYLFPWIWFCLVLILVRMIRTGNRLAGVDRLIFCESIVPLCFFLAVSCVQMTLPHWSLIGFLPLFPALGAMWAEWMAKWPRFTTNWLKVQAAIVLVVMSGVLLQSCLGLIPLRRDPTLEMKDWSPIVARLEERGLTDLPRTFFFTRSWFESGHLAFAMHNRYPVACFDVDARGFAYWSKPLDWLGRDGILLSHGDNPNEPGAFVPYFRKIVLIDEFPETRNGQPVGNRTIRVFHCIDQKLAFPFRARPPQPGQTPTPDGQWVNAK